jgi:3-isopropylmalate/(R)-2-methylmalate dehydratase large subunit
MSMATDSGVPTTLFDKIWDAHVIVRQDDGRTLLFVDRHLLHDGSFHPFARLAEKGLEVPWPALCLATPDHYVPTVGRDPATLSDPGARRVLMAFGGNVGRHGIPSLPLGDGREGIVHVVGPEQGFTLPGVTLVCGDSHTSTHGALGALAFGIGASEAAHVLATQAIWQMKPKSMRIRVDGRLADGVGAKDLVLSIIARIGADGAVGHVIEYAGSAITALSIEQRCTVCNMSIEAGARAGLVAPDDVTFAYVKGRPLAPAADRWDAALAHWRLLRTDPGARFDREVVLDAARVEPMVTWGTSPEHAVSIDGRVPDPDSVADVDKRESMASALRYMALEPGRPLGGLPIDRVFIGSCTNGRLGDLREAAAVIRRIGGRVRIPAIVSPGSMSVKRAAEAEGLDRVFLDAGLEWRDAGCSMCVGMNGDLVAAGERCASTSNRNFEGRQGREARTHLVSPATAAATALRGHLCDARESR